MNPANLPFDAEAMLQGLRSWVECESPTWDAAAVNRMLDLAAREMAIMGATIERIAGRQGFGGCVRARFPHPQAGRARHSDRGASRHRASGRHAGEAAVAARGQQMLRPRHLRHEGRQLPGAGSDPAAGARRVHDAAADHRAVHAGRRGRHALDPRPDRGRSGAQQICAGARARPARQRRRHRPLRDRALQSRSDRQAEPCRRDALVGPLRDPRNGAADHRHRRHDDGRTALSASASSTAANGSTASPPPAPARR